ncbi:Hint domain-containing protein [Aliiroseovarius sp.]|uniref:Hint domain-containing protein n=1 Tax=Aliiroseovarius sp. TaxID=1872442 RepID=UPI002634E829|nr:Hint domain-containing protein [Aliiroseovarius sp.]
MPVYTLDFENLAAGDIVNNQYEGQGVTISSKAYHPAMVFDTDNPTGGDWDLATSNLGNVLIVSEDGDSSDPDDNAGGGSVYFTFDEPTDVKNLTVLDNEEGGYVRFWDVDGNYLGKVELPTTGNNGQALAELNMDDVGYMQVSLCGSGAIDNITYDSPIHADPEGDGYVEGTAGDDLIDAAYTGDPEGDMIDAGDAILPGEGPQDDIVLAGAGDDTVISGEGDDEIYAGSGDDFVDGGVGDDTIYGDGNLGGQTDVVREKFEWDEAPGFSDEAAASAFTQNTGNVEVTFSILDTNESPQVEYEDKPGNVDGIDTGGLGDVDPGSNLALESNSNDEGATVALDFSDEVQSVEFNINDVDHDSEVWVRAYDADGTEVTVNLSGGSDVSVSGNHAGSNGGSGQPGSSDYSVQVVIPGPVARIEVVHNQDGGDTSHVQITDVYFDVMVGTVDNGPAGNDTLLGGAGDDVIYGEGGDDEIHGGDGSDTISGGDGSDTVFGGDGDDVIDTSGSDPRTDYGWPGVIAPDADPFDDRDTVHGGAGNDTITTGDDQDTITGGTGEDTIDGGLDDDTIDGGEGNDFIIGGHGSDTIQGGAGNDEIWGGLGPDTDPFNAPDVDQPGDSFPIADPVPNNGIDVIHGGAGNDTIYGQDDADQLFGDAGMDYIDGGIDNDEIHGGDNADTLLGGQGDDTIFGDDGADIIEGGTGNDVVDGGRGADRIFGGEGDDLLDGGTGGDFIDGGAGDDTILGTTGRDELHGGDDNDTITGGLGEDVIDGGNGDDMIDAGGDDDIVSGGAGNDTITGGLGNDQIDGGADRDVIHGVNAGDTVDGGAAGDDWDVLDLTGSAPSGGSLAVTITGPDSNGNGSDGYVTYFDSNGDVTGTLQFEEIEEIVPCFTPGTLIATPKGERRVEELREGDRVITRDNGIQEIRWVGHKPLDWRQLQANRHLKPVLIQAGSLGNGLPERDMLVSPNHRVLVANDRTALYFEEREVLVSAKHLVDNKGVHRVDAMGTTYIHFMFDHHEVVLSDGAWTESFQPGDYALKGLGNAQRTEIFELFPELDTVQGVEDYTAARRTLKAHEAKMLIT